MKKLTLTIETHNKIIEPIERDIEALNQEIVIVKASTDVSIEILDVLVINIRKLIFKVTPQLSEHKKLLDKQNLLQCDLEIAKKRVLKLQTNHLVHLAIDLKELESTLATKKQEKSEKLQKPPEPKLHSTFELAIRKDAAGKWSLESRDPVGAPSWTKHKDLPDMPMNTTPKDLLEALKDLIKKPSDTSDGLVSIDSTKLDADPPVIIIRIRASNSKDAFTVAADIIEQASKILKAKEAKKDVASSSAQIP